MSKRVAALVGMIAILLSGAVCMQVAPDSVARADPCPPEGCGGGGSMPSGPPGGGTEFVPPSMPAMPSYEAGRDYPGLDQNNGISIYNSAAPQPSQAALPSQASVQNQDGSYNRAANGEQQPINYRQPPANEQINSQWQQRSDQLNSPSNNQVNQPNQETHQQPDQDRCDQLWSELANLPTESGDDSIAARRSEEIISALNTECGTLSAANPRQNSIRRLADSRVNFKQDAGSYDGVPCLNPNGDVWNLTMNGATSTLQYIDGAVRWTIRSIRRGVTAEGVTAAAPGNPVAIAGPPGSGLSAAFSVCPEGAGSTAGSQTADDVRKILSQVSKDGNNTRVVSSEEELIDLFNKLKVGGTEATPATYDGVMVSLSDGTRIGLRNKSLSGGKTIDVFYPTGRPDKVHIS